MEGQKEKEQKKPPPGTKTKSLCQICHQTEALFKCKDCPHLLCEPCKKNHGDIEDFKSHSVFDLCQIHDEGINIYVKNASSLYVHGVCYLITLNTKFTL